MTDAIKNDLDDQLEEIINEFHKTLSEKGFDTIEIQNFKLLEKKSVTKGKTCLEYKWIRRSNGTYYRKCMLWK